MIMQTFSQIEQAKGIHYNKADAKRSALSAWYDSVREKRFSDFSIGDWCRCVRQNLYLEHVMGYMLAELRNDPLAGEMYEGELASAFKSVSRDFWARHEKEKEEVQAFFRSNYENYPDDIKRDIDEVLHRWNERS